MTESDKKAADKAKRQETRLARVQGGIAELDLWLRDLVRSGLALLPEQPKNFWESMAARLVDAQAPGLAQFIYRLRDMDYTTDPLWQEKSFDLITQLWLAVRSFRQMEAHPPETQADLRTLIGWGTTPKEVMNDPQAETVDDEWLVFARHTERTDDITAQRDWLLGRKSGRYACLLHFAYKNMPIESPVWPGRVYPATLAFFPSAAPQRAVVRQIDPAVPPPASWPEPLPDWGTAEKEWAALRTRLPWLSFAPLLVADLIPVYDEVAGPQLFDGLGHCVPLLPLTDHMPFFRLLAISGGFPVTLLLLRTPSGCEATTVRSDGRWILL